MFIDLLTNFPPAAFILLPCRVAVNPDFYCFSSFGFLTFAQDDPERGRMCHFFILPNSGPLPYIEWYGAQRNAASYQIFPNVKISRSGNNSPFSGRPLVIVCVLEKREVFHFSYAQYNSIFFITVLIFSKSLSLCSNLSPCSIAI